MQSPSDAVQALEQASQKHEKEIVVELGIDRVLHYVGVYVMIFIAIVAKITEIADSKLSCYPARNTTTESEFIAYSESYCWETSQLTSTEISNSCNLQDFGARGEILMKDPVLYKTFMQWLPYVMIIEAFLMSIPTVWWHFRVGARLMGHLKFMQILLNDVYETVKPIPNGIYRRNGAYDRKGYYLDGWSRYEEDYKLESFRRKRVYNETDTTEEQTMKKTNPLTSFKEENEERIEENCLTRFMYGDIRDRHLFSMLCFENFSSLEQQPYILSVYKLSVKHEKASYKGYTGPKTKGIIRLVCNENNFSGRFLVGTYYKKHGFGFVISLAAFLAAFTMFILLWPDLWTSESFQCDVIYHEEKCVICTLLRKRDTLAFLIINMFVALLYTMLSLGQVIFVRMSANRAHSKYFEEIADTGSVALTGADS